MTTKSTTDNGPRTTDKQNWRLYAAAGAAALAAGSAADAAIIYVDPGTKPTASLPAGPLNGSATVNHPFTIDGVAASVGIQHLQSTNAHGNKGYAAFGGGIIGTSSDNAPKRFAAGSAVVPGSDGFNGRVLVGIADTNPNSNRRHVTGPFYANQTGFVGFKLPASEGGGAGWLRLELLNPDAQGNFTEVEAIDWAYNNAGGGINAGQGVSVPEPSAMGLLAMGSAGVLAWRRRREVKGSV